MINFDMLTQVLLGKLGSNKFFPRWRTLQFGFPGGCRVLLPGGADGHEERITEGEGAGVPEGRARLRQDAVRHHGPVHLRHGGGRRGRHDRLQVLNRLLDGQVGS